MFVLIAMFLFLNLFSYDGSKIRLKISSFTISDNYKNEDFELRFFCHYSSFLKRNKYISLNLKDWKESANQDMALEISRNFCKDADQAVLFLELIYKRDTFFNNTSVLFSYPFYNQIYSNRLYKNNEYDYRGSYVMQNEDLYLEFDIYFCKD